MRVCLINYTPYGTQGNTIVYKRSQSLARRGHKVNVIGIRKDTSATERRDRSVGGVQVHELPIERDVHSQKLLSFCARASNIVTTGSFDIVHVFSFRGAGLVPLLSPTRLLGATKWVYELIQVSFNRQPWKYRLSNELLAIESWLYDCVITSSDAILEEVYGKRSAKSELLHVLPLGVDTDRFRRDQAARRRRRAEFGLNDEIVLISVGSMNYERKLSIFLRGFARAVEAAGSQLHLVFVGDGEAKSDLIELATDLGVTDSTMFLGRVPFDEVPEYLSAADLGVSHISPTTPQSIQPALKVSEYLANGLPVLATETNGNSIYIEDGYNGFLYREQPDLIADAIQRAIDGDWEQLRSDCVNSVKQYDTDQLAKQLTEIYDNL